MKNFRDTKKEKVEVKKLKKKIYQKPIIKSFTDEEIKNQFGPVYACSPSPCTVSP